MAAQVTRRVLRATVDVLCISGTLLSKSPVSAHNSTVTPRSFTSTPGSFRTWTPAANVRGSAFCSGYRTMSSSSHHTQLTHPSSDSKDVSPVTLHEPYLPSEGSALMSLDGTPLPVPGESLSRSGESRHLTAAEMANEAAERITTMRAADMFESRARSGGFVPQGTAVPGNVESDNTYTGIGTAAMAGMVDAVAGAFVGETDRVARALSGMASGPPHGGATHNQTPAQAWRSEAQQPDDAAAEPDTSVLEYCMKNRARGL